MRKFAFAIAAAALVLLAGALTRGHDWKLDLKPPLHCQEFLADRHGCLPRVRSRLWARADLGLPAAAGLLVRPLPMVA
jgi:hypothetical protein